MASSDLQIVVTLRDKASKALGAISKKAKGLGSAAGKVMRAGVLAGGVALVGLAGLAVKFGTDFKNAENIIRVGTGATGEALDALNEDFKAVFAEVPADMKTVAQATADLNTRLGLTGEPLQDMTKRFVELSRITDTDVTANIEAVTRLFGDWSVATEDQAASLDRLFLTSQATGIGVDKLSQLVVQFGAPLRGFGFTLDESTAILAKFEKEGVNTEAVMGGLKIGLGKVAAAGKDPAIELAKVSEAIKTAGSVGEANVAAIEMFGSRAGPDMAAAIREGRFEVEDFISQMDAGGQGIMETAEATKTWQEKLKLLRNKALVKLEPVLVKFVDLIGEFADFLTDKAIPAVELFVGLFAATIRQDFMAMGNIYGRLPKPLQKYGDVVIKVGRFISDKLIPAFKDIASVVRRDLAPLFVSGLRVLQDFFNLALRPLFNFILNNKPALIAAIAAIGIAILLALGPGAIAIAAIIGLIVLIGLVRENFDAWKETVEGFVDAVVAKVEGIPVIGEIFKSTVQVITDKIDALKGVIQGLIDFVQELVNFVSAIFRGDWAAAWDSLKEMAKIALNLFLDYLQLTFLGTIRSVLKSLNVWALVAGAFNTAKDNMKGAFQSALDFITGLPGKFRSAASSVGSSIIEGLKSGIGAVGGIAQDIAQAVGTAIKGFINTQIIDKINRALEFKISMPGPIPDVSINPPDIPRLHKGGEVLRSGLAVVREGERYIAPGGAAAVTVNLNVSTPLNLASRADLERAVDFIEVELRRRRR